MNLLSAVMPGIREARTPLAIGALWMVAAYIIFARGWPEIVASIPAIGWLLSQVTLAPQLYAIGGLAFLAYLLGAALQPLSMLLATVMLRPLVREHYRREQPRGKLRKWFHSFVRNRLDVSEYLGPLSDAVMNAYTKGGLPATMSLNYPNEVIHSRFDATALQLWKSHPEQYQEYDRLRAEREFRRGVWLPLAVIGITLGFLTTWWIGAVVVVGSLTLVYQSWGIRHRQTVLIANALLQGLVEDAGLNAVVRTLRSIDRPESWRDKESVRCALTSVAMGKTGDFDSADNLTWEAAAAVIQDAVDSLEEEDEEPNLGIIELEIDQIAQEVRAIYRSNDEADSVAVFDAKLRDYRAAYLKGSAETSLSGSEGRIFFRH